MFWKKKRSSLAVSVMINTVNCPVCNVRGPCHEWFDDWPIGHERCFKKNKGPIVHNPPEAKYELHSYLVILLEGR